MRDGRLRYDAGEGSATGGRGSHHACAGTGASGDGAGGLCGPAHAEVAGAEGRPGSRKAWVIRPADALRTKCAAGGCGAAVLFTGSCRDGQWRWNRTATDGVDGTDAACRDRAVVGAGTADELAYFRSSKVLARSQKTPGVMRSRRSAWRPSPWFLQLPRGNQRPPMRRPQRRYGSQTPTL